MKLTKKLTALGLAVAMVASIGATSVFASEDFDVTAEQNIGITRATIHESTRYTMDNGTQAWTVAKVYDGSNVYYLRAHIQAYSNNGQLTGLSSENYNKYNISSAHSGPVTEKNTNRYYVSLSECRETSNSTTEARGGQTTTFY